ncbi:MAG TPA: SAM-dependent chlorinase/fluorinase, partial [Acidimicrobiales bacterium]
GGLTGTGAPVHPGPLAGADTVYFLSDYGLADEFVGVVHAVLRRLAPGVAIVDLVHQIPPYDVRAGAAALVRAMPHLGPGVVLAVVDPGVGGPRRGVVLETDGPERRWFVGPDNGLLLAAADRAGGIRRAVVLEPPDGRPAREDGVDAAGPATFDGRDVFAPAAAALCTGTGLDALGGPVDGRELARVPEPVVEIGSVGDGRRLVRAEVTWIDRFGNAQLGAPGATVPASVPVVAVAAGIRALSARRVRTFADLDPDEVGLLCDGNGQLALVVREGSAADRLALAPGDLVELVW